MYTNTEKVLEAANQFKARKAECEAPTEAFLEAMRKVNEAQEARDAAANYLDECISRYMAARTKRRQIESRIEAHDAQFNSAREALSPHMWSLHEASLKGGDQEILDAALKFAVHVAPLDELFVGLRGQQHDKDQQERDEASRDYLNTSNDKNVAKARLDEADKVLAAAEKEKAVASKAYDAAHEALEAWYKELCRAAFEVYGQPKDLPNRLAAQAREDGSAATYYPMPQF